MTRTHAKLAQGAGVAALFFFTHFAYSQDRFQVLWTARTENPYTQQSRQGIRSGLEAQAQAGLELDQTVWNHHFEPASDRLKPMGRLLLDRLARRGPALCVYLQQARDLPYTQAEAQNLLMLRQDLDARRLRAIQEYLAVSQPQVALNLLVHDRNPVGMYVIESIKAVREVYTTGRGILPQELQQGLGSVLRSSLGEGGGAGGIGGLPPPAPVSPGLGETPLPLGVDAVAPPPLPGPPPDAGLPPPPPPELPPQ